MSDLSIKELLDKKSNAEKAIYNFGLIGGDNRNEIDHLLALRNKPSISTARKQRYERMYQASRAVACIVHGRNEIVEGATLNEDSTLDQRDFVSITIENSDGDKTSVSLCPSERFYGQPQATRASAFLVREDVFATAYHCVEDYIDRDEVFRIRFVFGFESNGNDTFSTTVPTANVYRASEIIASNANEDWALVRVTRKVKDRTPLSLSSQEELAAGDELYLIGHPSGLPLKYADDGVVIGGDNFDPNGTHFETSLDAYAGNSGSCVLNLTTHKVEGILLGGNDDFVVSPNQVINLGRNCYISAVYGSEHPDGEVVVRSHVFASQLSMDTPLQQAEEN